VTPTGSLTIISFLSGHPKKELQAMKYIRKPLQSTPTARKETIVKNFNQYTGQVDKFSMVTSVATRTFDFASRGSQPGPKLKDICVKP
jgi:hypothetical protein